MATPDAQERLHELLAAEATASLDDSERAELGTLLATHRDVDRDLYMHIAAVAELAELRKDPQARVRMPQDVRGRALAALAPPAAGARSAAPTLRPPWWRDRRAWGWPVAAALALVALLPWLRTPPPPPTPAELRAQLLNGAPDVIEVPWDLSEVRGFEQVRGDVVWSNARQAGYLHLRGMPQNKPAVAQYQLWIIDPERDQHPVDGGVFDVSGADVIVPIDAKLKINHPKAFAVTRERHGGVVVSAGPLLIVAQAPHS